MLLTIDSGNSNAVFGLFGQGEEPLAVWRLSTSAVRTAEEYAVWLRQVMALDGYDFRAIDAVAIANVVPACNRPLVSLGERFLGTVPLVAGAPGVRLDVPVRVERPEQVGQDRLVNCLAARERYGPPFMIIDFGTATTFDVVDGEGAFRGGAIAPGAPAMLDALVAAAPRLPRVVIEAPPSPLAGTSATAMQSGLFWGYVGLIEGLVVRLQDAGGGALRVISTGGLASMFAAACPAVGTVDPTLTLRGLRALHRDNSRPPVAGPPVAGAAAVPDTSKES